MTPQQRLYLYGQGIAGAAVVNAVINGGIGWVITRKLAEFPVWSVPGVFVDIVATAFGVTFGTCIAMAIQVPRDHRKNKVSLPALSPSVSALVARFPAGTLKRALSLGALSVPLFVPPAAALLAAWGTPALPRDVFVAFKAVFSGIEGAVVTPLIVLGVLRDVTRPA